MAATPKPTTNAAVARHLAAHNALKSTGFRAAAKAKGFTVAEINAARQKFLVSAKAGKPAIGSINKLAGAAHGKKVMRAYRNTP